MSTNFSSVSKYGNLVEKLLNQETPIYLCRVWGYESGTTSNIYSVNIEHYKKRMNDSDEIRFIQVLQFIRGKVNAQGWNDNKIVVEIEVGAWRVFIGYWDFYITIGLGLIPNNFAPNYKEGSWYQFEPIQIRLLWKDVSYVVSLLRLTNILNL